MKILFVAPELYPYVKTGGLGDVAQALPAALSELGLDVRILVPGYRPLLAATIRRPLAQVDCPFLGVSATLSEARDTQPSLLILEYAPFYDRPGGPYQNTGEDWPDNAERYALLCHAAANLCGTDSVLQWQADIVHCNDWQSGLIPAYLHFSTAARAKSVMTIHNLAFQGLFPAACVPQVGLPAEAFSIQGAEFYDQLSFLKAGIFYANHITTVSPSYATEIQQPELGFGLDGLLRQRAKDITGILNGIDTTQWNPAADPALKMPYSAGKLNGKLANKLALQSEAGLPVDASIPLLGMVSRIAEQKGSDLVIEILPQLIKTGAQFIVLGSGDATLERALLDAAVQARNQISVHIGYDEDFAHRVEAGSDMFLMPSRFEPCGLNQMYSMRYGTPPIVHATGGLRDTVCDPSSSAADAATGFIFADADSASLMLAIDRALATWHDRKSWQRLQRNGMHRDFSWRKSAERYIKLYRSLL